MLTKAPNDENCSVALHWTNISIQQGVQNQLWSVACKYLHPCHSLVHGFYFVLQHQDISYFKCLGTFRLHCTVFHFRDCISSSLLRILFPASHPILQPNYLQFPEHVPPASLVLQMPRSLPGTRYHSQYIWLWLTKYPTKKSLLKQ